MARVIKSGSVVKGKTAPAKGGTNSGSKPGGSTSARTSSSGAPKPKTSSAYNSAASQKAPESASSAKTASGKPDLSVPSVKLTLKRISPLSAAKMGFFVSLALGIALVLAVSIFYLMLDTSGIIFQFSQSLVSSGLGLDLTGAFSVGKVAIITAVLACANVAFITLLSALVAAIYNMAARLTGGLKINLVRE